MATGKNYNYYELLGVSVDSNPKKIRQAYRKLQKKYHPDVAGQEVIIPIQSRVRLRLLVQEALLHISVSVRNTSKLKLKIGSDSYKSTQKWFLGLFIKRFYDQETLLSLLCQAGPRVYANDSYKSTQK